jgi:hypothetical protein
MTTALCPTTLDKPFRPLTFPPPEQASVPGSEVPVYLSSECCALDKFYHAIDPPIDAAPACGSAVFSVITHESLPLVFRPQDAPGLAMPEPHAFDRRERYLAALAEWHARARKCFGLALLPSPISGLFHLPEPPKIFTREEKADAGRFRTFRAALWPLLPENYLAVLERVLRRAPFAPDEPFARQIPKREVIYYRHHITDRPQWLSQLCPAEPRAALYDSYAEYVRACLGWAGAAQAGLHTAILPAREFARIAAIDTFTPARRAARAPAADARARARVADVCPHPRRFPARMAPAFPARAALAPALAGLGGRAAAPLAEPLRLDVFGVNRAKFLGEHQALGYSTASVEQGTPIPRVVTHPSGGTACVDDICSLLMAAISYDFSLVRQVLDADLSPQQFDEVMRFEINGARVCAFISQILNSASAIRQLTNLARISEAYRFRVSFLLAAVFRNDSTTSLPKTLMTPACLDAFHRTVSSLNLTSVSRVPLIPATRDQTRFHQTINRFYLVSTLLSIMSDCQSAQWYQNALDACRDLAREIGEALQTRADQLRPSQPGSDAYTSMLMIFSSQSVQLTRMLLGPDCLKWMRPRLLMRIEHSGAIVLAARAVLIGITERVYEPLCNWTLEMPPHVISFLESACGSLRRQALECGVRVGSLAVMSLFDAILSTNRAAVERLVLPIARLLSDRRVMANFTDQAYQQRLTASVCWLCNELPSVLPVVYKLRMQALALFAHDESICSSMCSLRGFSAFIIGHLSDTEGSIIPVNWGFFTLYAGHPRVIHEILSSTAANALAAIVTSDCTAVLRRFLEFSIDLWRRQSGIIVGRFCEVMMSSLGRLTAVYRTRKAMFKDDERMVQLIDEYARTLAQLDSPGSEKFIEAFGKYTETDMAELVGKRPSRMRERTQRLSSAAERDRPL